MNKIFKWLAQEPRTTYVWYDANEKFPPEEGMYLVIRENQGRLGGAHFDMYCADKGWMQVSGARVGKVVLWTEAPETPKQVKK